jgi:hypothetical protein
MLRAVHDVYKDRAMRRLQDEYPDLKQALRMDKQNRIIVKHGREQVNPIDAIRAISK